MKYLFILPIKGYQYFISPLLGNNCRHVPSCSQYMIEAIQQWGILRGIWIGTKRLLRCHPWGTSGYDPVPAKKQIHSQELIELEEGLEPALQFEKRGGLIPVVVQETSTGQILMMASVNRSALELTFKTHRATFWSTSRQQIWAKGETFENILEVDKVLVDCDQDALVYQVSLKKGGVCHTSSSSGDNRKSCFYRIYKDGILEFLPGTK